MSHIYVKMCHQIVHIQQIYTKLGEYSCPPLFLSFPRSCLHILRVESKIYGLTILTVSPFLLPLPAS